MGFAMLWIVYFHSGLIVPSLLNSIKLIGYGGVDIFIFSSGIGNYYSYLKEESPLDFFKRKILRLAPVYLPFIIIWCIYKLLIGELEMIYVPGNILGIQPFSSSGISINWYLSLIIICYILTPYLATYIKSNDLKNCIILTLILIVASTAFINDEKFIIVITRLPIYAIGMIFAKYRNYPVKKTLFPLAAMFLIGFISLKFFSDHCQANLWKHGLSWYPFILITPFLCYLISMLSIFCEKYKLSFIIYVPKMIGKITFEIFLIHLFIFDIVQAFNKTNSISNIGWILLIVLSISIAFFYNKIIEKSLIRKTYENKKSQ
jgi:peptidoglycan/LPS O-acetylase OafA/YrhL